MKLFFTLTLLFVLLAIAFIFGSQNEQIIELNYLVAKTEITVAAAVSIFTLLGTFIGVLFSVSFSIHRKLKRKQKLKLAVKQET